MVYGSTLESASFVDDVQSSRIYPETASVSEMSDLFALSLEESYNGLFQGIALDELGAYMESGQVVVCEGFDLDKLKDKAEKLFKDAWAKIKELYEKFLDKMDAISKKFKDQIKKYLSGSKMEEALNKFENNTTYYKGYSFKGAEDKIADPKVTTYYEQKKVGAAVETAIKAMNNAASNYKADDNAGDQAVVDKMKNDCDTAYKAFLKSLDFAETDVAGDMKKKVLDFITNGGKKNYEYKGSFIRANFKDMLDYCCEFSKGKRAVKKCYAEDKKSINDAIKEMKKGNSDKAIHVFTGSAKKVIQTLMTVRAQDLACMAQRHAVYRAMVLKAAFARVGTKPKGVKESFAYQSGSVQSESVASLFNWDN